MKYIIRNKATGRYAKGNQRHTRGWTDDIDNARVFNRVVDVKNSDAYYTQGGAEIVEVRLVVAGVRP